MDPRLIFAIICIALIFGVPCALLIRHARSRLRPTEAEVEAAVETWHREYGCGGPLHEYLGWTWPEYAAWVSNPDKIPARPLAHGRG